MLPVDRRPAIPNQNAEPPTLLDILHTIKGNPAVYWIQLWRVRDDQETGMDGSANRIAARITLKPGSSLEDISRLNWQQLSRAGNTGTGSLSLSEGEYPRYDFDQIEPDLYSEIIKNFPTLTIRESSGVRLEV